MEAPPHRDCSRLPDEQPRGSTTVFNAPALLAFASPPDRDERNRPADPLPVFYGLFLQIISAIGLRP